MRNDLNVSEKRLIAALDRIDAALDQMGPRQGTALDAPPQDAVVAGEATRIADLQAQVSELQRQLSEAGQQAVRMAAANDALGRANRKLLDAGGSISGDDASAALQAEIDALRAARGAEISQMGEIVDALDRMLDTPPLDTGRNATKAARAAKADPDAVIEDDQGAEAAEGERG